MTDQRDQRSGSMDQAQAGEDEEGQLTKQTPGLDAGVTDAIAGPDWDPQLVEEAKTSVQGEPLTGEIERGAPGSESTSGPSQGSSTAASSTAGSSAQGSTASASRQSEDPPVGGPFGSS